MHVCVFVQCVVWCGECEYAWMCVCVCVVCSKRICQRATCASTSEPFFNDLEGVNTAISYHCTDTPNNFAMRLCCSCTLLRRLVMSTSHYP